jgi:hypothetical protein
MPVLLLLLALLAPQTAHAQGIQQLQQWNTSGAYIRLASSTAGLLVPSLTNCDTIDTDSSGKFRCGTDATGAGSSVGEAWKLDSTKSWLLPTTTLGIIVSASSTIGDGTSGLAVNGNASTSLALKAGTSL